MNSSNSLVQRPRVRRSDEEWQNFIHQYEQSGQTQAAFCDGQSLALSTFSRWRQRLRAMSASPPVRCEETAFVELSTLDEAVTAPPSAVWDVELQLGTDIVLRLRQRC